MIGFTELASQVENTIFFLFAIVVNHVGFILIIFNISIIIAISYCGQITLKVK